MDEVDCSSLGGPLERPYDVIAKRLHMKNATDEMNSSSCCCRFVAVAVAADVAVVVAHASGRGSGMQVRVT